MQFVPRVKGTEVLRHLIFVENIELPSSDKVGKLLRRKAWQKTYSLHIRLLLGDIFNLLFSSSVDIRVVTA